jgi:hypothetical protein
MPIAGSEREYPPMTRFLEIAGRDPDVWIDVEKVFWWDMPVWVASGHVDSVGIAHNHMHRGGVLGNEAWGKTRDTSQYPGIQGNGYWTQWIYYQLLNAGMRIPPSAGSASGVLPNPVGYNRVFAHVEGELTWAKWWESVRQGRVFVSNGPLLRVTANNHFPGQVFRVPEAGSLLVTLNVQLDSFDPVETVEIIRNGKIVETLKVADEQGLSIETTLTVAEPGWFLARAVAEVPETFRFASTGPFYVEDPAGKGRISRGAAAFFVAWVRDRMTQLNLEDPDQRDEVMRAQKAAERFWMELEEKATCD